ncbi:hypothetical protein [Vulcanisaeta thermophila]|uniref:hypothetical protein n=1 Tax=Vulcanisaeta thermophila TaxID=867917 RepID=UPI0008532B0A|nr:hypothetical protein [Vulcanisaeta thermophila]
MLILLWNLPKNEFISITEELARTTGRREVDLELTWQLMGGNVRALEDLALDFNWNINEWIEAMIIRQLREP